MSVGFSVVAPDLKRLERRLVAVSNENYKELLEGVGGIVESQSRRRIQDEKTGPDGSIWKEWSESYAASKHGAENHDPHPGSRRESQGHTILSLTGGLLDSLQHALSFADEVEVGSNLVYARRQNADRPFLGLSGDNERDVLETVEDFLDELMRPLV